MIKIISLYFIICILIRLLLTYTTYKNYNNNYRYLLIIFYLISSIGLLYNYIKNNRIIGVFGETVWWQNYRLIHSVIYIIVCILLFYKYKCSWKLLLLSVIIAIYGHIKNRYY